MFCSEKDWHYILWNNKQILINNKTVYYKSYFEAGVVHISDLSFDLNNKDSFSLVSNRISKTNFLVWAGLRHSIPSILKNSTHKSTTGELSLASISSEERPSILVVSFNYPTIICCFKTYFVPALDPCWVQYSWP